MIKYTKCLLALLAASECATAQETFQNLNFESATVPASGLQPPGTFVPIGSALPGWTAYIGTQQVTEVGYNSPANSVASVTVIGPTWNGPDVGIYGVGVIDGNYSVDLQTGASSTPQGINVSIEQNGTVPSFAQSLQFEALETTPLSVTFNGTALSPVALSSGVSADGLPYTLYGADISAWANTPGELEFTAVFNGSYNYDILDDISFSQTAITPEPSPLILTGIGSLIFALHRRFRTR